MKRLLCVSTTVALMLGLAMSHSVLSAPPAGKGKGKAKKAKPQKVLVCHITEREGDDGTVTVRGKVISISDRAVPAHLRHGDCVIAVGDSEEFPKGSDCSGLAPVEDDPATTDVDESEGGLCAPIEEPPVEEPPVEEPVDEEPTT